MRRIATSIPDLVLLETDRHGDERGFLAELFNGEALAAQGIGARFVQDNFSLSPRPFTVRGLHFQAPPHAQAKLVRVIRGVALTVAVDLRCGSPWYGRHVACELSAANWRQLFLPKGFAHGLLTLAAETETFMKLDAIHAPGAAGGLAWDDPELAIAWPCRPDQAIVSARDRQQPRLRDLPAIFTYGDPERS
jgi:dTDP-4-dehydrorhamnose 3,5-epimerase